MLATVGHEEGLKVRVAGIVGKECEIVSTPSWTVRDLKTALELETGLPRSEQLLSTLVGDCLKEDTLLHGLQASPGGPLHLRLAHCPLARSEWQARIRTSWTELRNAPAWAKEDREAALSAVRQHGLALRLVAEDLQSDREIVLTAIRQNALALEFASASLRADREVALVALMRSGDVLRLLPEELRRSREVVLAAVRQCGRALAHASADLRDDKEVVLTAVEQNPSALADAGEVARADRALVLAAVAADGDALRLAPRALRADRTVVAAAVRQHSGALMHASPELQADPDMKQLAAQGRLGHSPLPMSASGFLHPVAPPEVGPPSRTRPGFQRYRSAPSFVAPSGIAPGRLSGLPSVFEGAAATPSSCEADDDDDPRLRTGSTTPQTPQSEDSPASPSPPSSSSEAAAAPRSLRRPQLQRSSGTQHLHGAPAQARSPLQPPAATTLKATLPQPPPIASDRFFPRHASFSGALGSARLGSLGGGGGSGGGADAAGRTTAPVGGGGAYAERLGSSSARCLGGRWAVPPPPAPCFGDDGGGGGLLASPSMTARGTPRTAAMDRLKVARDLSALSLPELRSECSRRSLHLGQTSPTSRFLFSSHGTAGGFSAEECDEESERSTLMERLLVDAGVHHGSPGEPRSAALLVAAAERVRSLEAFEDAELRRECLELGLPAFVVETRPRSEVIANLSEAQLWNVMSMSELLHECRERDVAAPACLGSASEQRAAVVEQLLLDAWAPALEAAGVPARRLQAFRAAVALAARHRDVEAMAMQELSSECHGLGLPPPTRADDALRHLKSVALWAALPLAELRKECRDRNLSGVISSPMGGDLNDRPLRDELLNRLTVELCGDWYDRQGVPVRRIGSAKAAARVLEKHRRFKASLIGELQAEYRSYGFPMEAGLDADVLLRRLRAVALWEQLPCAELRRECQELGVSADGLRGSDEERRRDLQERLLITLCEGTFQVVGVPARRLGSVRSAALVAESFKRYSVMGSSELRRELERLGGCSLATEREELETHLRRALIWTELPFNEVLKDSSALGLPSVRRETRRDLVLRLCLASWGPNARQESPPDSPGGRCFFQQQAPYGGLRLPPPRHLAAHFKTLQLSTTATDADVRSAYRKLALRLHPDKVLGEDKEQAVAEFRRVSDAYRALSDYLRSP